MFIQVIRLYLYHNNKQTLKTDTMTQQELLQVATEKKFQIIHSFNVLNLPIIGIDKHENSIHWFFVHDSGNVYFDHTYNLNTGKVKKSLSHMINITWSFEKHLS